MESIFLFVLMWFGAALVWKRLTRKASVVSSEEEAGGVLFFLLFAGFLVFMFLMWILAQTFPAMKHDRAVGLLALFGVGTVYLWALLRFADWVIGGKRKE